MGEKRETYTTPKLIGHTECCNTTDTHSLWWAEGSSLLSQSSSAWFCQTWRFLWGLACQTWLLSAEMTDVTYRALTLLLSFVPFHKGIVHSVYSSIILAISQQGLNCFWLKYIQILQLFQILNHQNATFQECSAFEKSQSDGKGRNASVLSVHVCVMVACSTRVFQHACIMFQC